MVPFARQTEVPPTVRLFERFRVVPVPFVKRRVVRLDRPVMPRLVEVVLVPVALVQVMLVALKALPAGMLKRPVTARLVVVALVEVVLAKLPFQRRAGEPRERRASTRGLKLAEAPPVTAMLVVVAFVVVRFVPFPVVKPKTDPKRFVDVVLVPVAFTKRRDVDEV